MIRINLLPFRAARKKENIRRQVSIFLLSLLLLGIIVGYVHYWLGTRITKLNEEIANAKIQVAKYNKINQEIAEINKKLQILDTKIGVIESLDLNRKAPVQLLDSMTNLLVPNRMWFTSFKYDGTKIEIDGIALDNQTVADFMTRVEGEDAFIGVKLSSIKQEKITGKNINLKKFGVAFAKNSPKTSKAEKAE
jgi:type IV pilus assembly protein PilN